MRGGAVTDRLATAGFHSLTPGNSATDRNTRLESADCPQVAPWVSRVELVAIGERRRDGRTSALALSRQLPVAHP